MSHQILESLKLWFYLTMMALLRAAAYLLKALPRVGWIAFSELIWFDLTGWIIKTVAHIICVCRSFCFLGALFLEELVHGLCVSMVVHETKDYILICVVARCEQVLPQRT